MCACGGKWAQEGESRARSLRGWEWKQKTPEQPKCRGNREGGPTTVPGQRGTTLFEAAHQGKKLSDVGQTRWKRFYLNYKGLAEFRKTDLGGRSTGRGL